LAAQHVGRGGAAEEDFATAEDVSGYQLSERSASRVDGDDFGDEPTLGVVLLGGDEERVVVESDLRFGATVYGVGLFAVDADRSDGALVPYLVQPMEYIVKAYGFTRVFFETNY
jgi:hypothetical protein